MESLDHIRDELLRLVRAATSRDTLEQIRVAALGRKGQITELMKELGSLAADLRKERGAALNVLKTDVEAAVAEAGLRLEGEALAHRLKTERVDVTLPVTGEPLGRIHPISQTLDEVVAIFGEMGFAVAEGPHIEDDFHNFTALNIPPEHPARQEHDTFYLASADAAHRKVLRTHTSPVQVRTMMAGKPPFRIIAPGRTFRCDHDATHAPMFHQVEGLVVDRATHMGHLKGCLIEFCRAFFDIDELPVRFRPSYFPFTEPSAEVDIGCSRDGGGLKIGAGGDWLEILGCGMVHPKVLANCGVDPEHYQGFAFGMGIERIAMLKYGIPDLRTFFESDLRWLRHYGFLALEQPSLVFGGRGAMKTTLAWLKTHLDTSATLDALVALLVMRGFEVDGIENRAANLAPFRTARVLKAEPHPNADKLRLCVVDTGGGHVQVVCGAPNARAGLVGVFAPPGALIPRSGLVLKASAIRGVASNGMLCSGWELNLSEDREGIIELPEDIAPGRPFAEVMGLDDPVLDIKVTANRGDCLGVRGIARDLAAAGAGQLLPLGERWYEGARDLSAADRPVEGRFPCPIAVHLAGPDDKACPLFIGRLVRGVTNGPSPRWLASRLEAIGLRPISALVDITNFITFDLCRPLHVFDAAKLDGDLAVRGARAHEELAALNGRTYALDPEMTVIADNAGPVSLGGVIGGERTGCTEATRDVYIEAALFDPVRTAATGRKLNLQSDARYRFERGLDPEFVEPGIEIATRLIQALCGGEASAIAQSGEIPLWRHAIRYRRERPRTLGGLELTASEQHRILAGLGCIVEEGTPWSVEPPSWRPDIEGEADLVEEVLRVHGYEHIPAVPLLRESALPKSALDAGQRRAAFVRRSLAARGLIEAVTYSFMPSGEAALFGNVPPSLMLANPISADLDAMRPSLLPNLLSAARRNADRGFPDAALYEVGAQYRDDTPAGQELWASGVRTGVTGAKRWDDAGRAVDAFLAKADAVAVLAAGGIAAESLQVVAEPPPWYHPGRAGSLRLGPKVLAHYGEVHPAVAASFGLKGAAVAFEVALDAVPQPRARGPAKPLLKLSPFQPVERDFAFIVPLDLPAETLLRAARGVDKKLVAEVRLFDVYTGPGMGEGSKSLAITVVLQPEDATLTDAMLEGFAKKLVAAVEKATGGTLRS